MNATLATAQQTPYIDWFNDPVSAAYGFTHYVSREYPVTEIKEDDNGRITGIIIDDDGAPLPVEFIDIPFYSEDDPRQAWVTIIDDLPF